MCQPAKSEIVIEFYTLWGLPKEFKNETNITYALLEYYWTTIIGQFSLKHHGKSIKPEINILRHVTLNNTVELVFYGETMDKLNFQIKLLKEYLENGHEGKTSKIKDDIWVRI